MEHSRRFSEFTSDIELSEFIKYYSDVSLLWLILFSIFVKIFPEFCCAVASPALGLSQGIDFCASSVTIRQDRTGLNKNILVWSCSTLAGRGWDWLKNSQVLISNVIAGLGGDSSLINSWIELDWLQFKCVQCNCDLSDYGWLCFDIIVMVVFQRLAKV